MLKLQTWFIDYTKSPEFKIKFNNLLQSKHLTTKNIKDFNNLNYNITKYDIFKYVTVLEYLGSIKEYDLVYMLNPSVKANSNKKEGAFYVHNDILQVNQYKNIIIDLYFLDVPEQVNSIPLNIVWGLTKDKETIKPYLSSIKEVYELGYGFNYFGELGVSKMFNTYLIAFYRNINLYNYNEKLLTLNDLLFTYSENLNKQTLSLDSIKDLTLKISKDRLITKHAYKCVDMLQPDLDKELDSFLSNYCLFYDYANPLDELFDVYAELDLIKLLESNLNSKFVENLIKQ